MPKIDQQGQEFIIQDVTAGDAHVTLPTNAPAGYEVNAIAIGTAGSFNLILVGTVDGTTDLSIPRGGSANLFSIGPGKWQSAWNSVGFLALGVVADPVPTANGGFASDLSAAGAGEIPYSDGATPAVFGTSPNLVFATTAPGDSATSTVTLSATDGSANVHSVSAGIELAENSGAPGQFLGDFVVRAGTTMSPQLTIKGEGSYIIFGNGTLLSADVDFTIEGNAGRSVTLRSDTIGAITHSNEISVSGVTDEIDISFLSAGAGGLYITPTFLEPQDDNLQTLGAADHQWKDGYFGTSVNTPKLVNSTGPYLGLTTSEITATSVGSLQIPFAVNTVSGSTANKQEWRSDGTPVAYVDTNGLIAANEALLAGLTAPVDAVASTGTIGQTGTPGDGNTVTVNGRAYTFKTALTPANDEVLINGGDGSLTNLEHAINNSGGVPGTDYQVATANADVTAGDVGGNAITLTAIIKGTVGDAITLAKNGANLTVNGGAGPATLGSGVDGTVGAAGQIRFASANAYLCTATATTADTGKWKKITIGSL